jgi:hypothetical protein
MSAHWPPFQRTLSRSSQIADHDDEVDDPGQADEPEGPPPTPITELSTSDCRYGLFDLNPKCGTGALVALHRVFEASALVRFRFDQGFDISGAVPLPSSVEQVAQDPKTGTWYAVRDSVFGTVRLGVDGTFATPRAFFESLERPPAPTLTNPTAVAFDTRRRRALVTAESEGFFGADEGQQLFAYEPDGKRWLHLANLGSVELAAMTYLPAADLFCAVSRTGTLYRLSANGALIDQRQLPGPITAFREVQLLADGERVAIVARQEGRDFNPFSKTKEMEREDCFLIDVRTLRVEKNNACALR